MIKKTIKFYFFKNRKKKLEKFSQSYLFCFSNRGLYQNKYILNYKGSWKVFFRKKKKNWFISPQKQYINYIIIKIILHQWNRNKNILRGYFCKSFFLLLLWFIKSQKYFYKAFMRLKLWFVFKNKFNRFLKKFIYNYPNLGFLTSHVGHFLSRKNLSYQARSKYRSKLFMMNLYSEKFYNDVKQQNVYISSLLCLLYGFSADPRARNIYLDVDFNINNTQCISIFNKQFGCLDINFDNNDIFLLYKYNILIENFLTELDTKQVENLKQQLSLKIDTNKIIVFSRFFIFFEFFDGHTNNLLDNYIYFYIKFYLAIYYDL